MIVETAPDHCGKTQAAALGDLVREATHALAHLQPVVLEQLATGATNPAIAASLHLSERTVAHHVSSILGKLGAATRLAAVQRARDRGLLHKDGPPAAPR